MIRYPDSYHTLTPCQLWEAAQDGWPGAIPALVDRFGSLPPGDRDPAQPPATAWAELLTASTCPFCNGAGAAHLAAPVAFDEVR